MLKIYPSKEFEKDTPWIQTPQGTIMSNVSTKPFSIHGVPNSWFVIFSAWKDEISFPVVLDLRDRSLVTMKQQRFLKENKVI